MEWLRGPGPEARRPAGNREEGAPGVGAAAPRQGEGAPGYRDRAGTGAPGCWLGPRSLERGAEGGDGRVRLRRGRGRQGGPPRDLPVPGAASLGWLESLLSFSPGRAPPPGARLVVFLLFLLLLHHHLRLLLLL